MITSVYLSLLKTAVFFFVHGMHIEIDLLKKGRKKAQEISINSEIQVDKGRRSLPFYVLWYIKKKNPDFEELVKEKK